MALKQVALLCFNPVSEPLMDTLTLGDLKMWIGCLRQTGHWQQDSWVEVCHSDLRMGSPHTPIQENFIYKKQGPSPISLVRATRIFSKAKTLKKNFDLSLAIGDIPIYPF